MRSSTMIRRFLALCVVAIGFSTIVPVSSALANPKYASIIIDAESGQVIRARSADKKLYPASLTKMMTLYMTFDAIRSGKLSLDQKVQVSKFASRKPASKLGLRAGQWISIRDLIEACAVKSANDAAAVLAEAVGGSEKNFARMMTRKARALGMSRTTFKNASGLTAKGQLSTARDMAVLGRRLFVDFPQFYHNFERRSFSYNGRKLRATNKLLGTYRGADGIKTGYTRASGFNLVASAERNGRRIIGVVFGGKSGARRNRHMKALLDQGFKNLPPRQAIGALIASPLPRYHPDRGPAPRMASIPRPKPNGQSQPSALVAMGEGGATGVVELSLRALQYAIVPPANAGLDHDSRGAWAAQIGAYRKRTFAERRLAVGGELRLAELEHATPLVSVRTSGGRPLYRSRFAGLEKADAKALCKRFESKGIDCFTVKNNRR